MLSRQVISVFTAGPGASAASCHVISLSPRGLVQTPVVRKQGGGGGMDPSLGAAALL